MCNQFEKHTSNIHTTNLIAYKQYTYYEFEEHISNIHTINLKSIQAIYTLLILPYQKINEVTFFIHLLK